MKNKNAFTLIELLATVIIMGILTTIATAGYSAYIRKNNQNYYQNLENTVKETMVDFFSDNRGLLPKEVGENKTIDLEILKNQNYIESLVDAKGISCRGTGTVYKKGVNQYDYKVCIMCPSYKETIGNGC